MNARWPIVRLGEVATSAERGENPVPGTSYRQIGVKLWGEGAYERERIDGGATKYARLFRTEAGDIVVNKIWARNGSVAVVPASLAGCYGSGEFPMFAPNPERLNPRWIHWLTKTRAFWTQCDDKSRGTSGKNRIRPEQFLEIDIPLPSMPEQQRALARIDQLAARIDEIRILRKQQESDIKQMLLGAFHRIALGAPRLPMREVAPQIRRPVKVDPTGSYPELGIRSFGKGTFHKPALSGVEIGGKRVFRMEPGDLLFSNVFAWEGAIAVAKPDDSGRFGSHRYIACVPKQGAVTSDFLCFYFLTPEGLESIGKASPGGAGRNRTLGLAALDAINVPVPPFAQQQWFDSLRAKVDTLIGLQADTDRDLDALMSSILDQAFGGEL